MEYTLIDKQNELKEDIKTFSNVIKNTEDKSKIKMYQNLIKENERELTYLDELIAEKGISYDNYDYDV